MKDLRNTSTTYTNSFYYHDQLYISILNNKYFVNILNMHLSLLSQFSHGQWFTYAVPNFHKRCSLQIVVSTYGHADSERRDKCLWTHHCWSNSDLKQTSRFQIWHCSFSLRLWPSQSQGHLPDTKKKKKKKKTLSSQLIFLLFDPKHIQVINCA